MEVQNNAGQREYTCTTCGTDYQGRKYIADKAQRFCSRSCKEKAARAVKAVEKAKAKVVSQLERWWKSAKGQYHIRKCKDAGTAQIMQGHTKESLLANDELYNRFYKCYGWDADEKKSVFNICHVQSQKGRDGSRGLLDSRQLFIGAAAHNQVQSDKPVPADAGMSIPAHKLDRKWSIPAGATNESVAKKIRSLLGKEFDAYLLSGTIKLNKRYATAQRIYNRQQKGTEVNRLDRVWTKPELEALEYEVLEAMDAHQSGKDVSNKFKPEVYTRALLCVYAEELERFGEVLPEGRHKDNCRFMLPLVRVLGIYIAQTEDVLDRSHRSFLSVPGAEWKPIQRNSGLYWGKSPHSVMACDFAYMKETILQGAFDALQGLRINKERYEDHLLKRLLPGSLVPVVDTPTSWSWVASGGNWDEYITHLYAASEPVWQTLLDLDLCTASEVEAARADVLWAVKDAIDRGRRKYRADPKFQREVRGKVYTAWGWRGYPQWLEYPAALVEQLDLTSELMVA